MYAGATSTTATISYYRNGSSVAQSLYTTGPSIGVLTIRDVLFLQLTIGDTISVEVQCTAGSCGLSLPSQQDSNNIVFLKIA